MEILAFKGLVLGLIYSVALVSGTVWSVQVTLRNGFMTGMAVAVAIALAQGILAGMAALALYGLLLLPMQLELPLRLMATAVFLYMAGKMFFAPRVESLTSEFATGSAGRLFAVTFALSITMPMRLGGYLAFAIAAGLPTHGLSVASIPVVAFAALFGALTWFVYIVVLARLFGQRVPEHISLRSINKLNMLSGMVFLLVAFITGLPLLV